MNSLTSTYHMKQFPPLMWIILFGTFLTRGSFFMVWPFLAVILYNRFGLSATEVGLILSSASLVSVVVSFIGSSLSDLIGRNRMMYGTGILYIVSFALLAEADTVPMFIGVITLCSIASSLWRPLCAALIGDIIDDSDGRELAMQALYFAVNLGCAIGPIAGVSLGLTGEQSSFYLTTWAFALLLVMLHFGFAHQHKLNDVTQTRKTLNVNSSTTSISEMSATEPSAFAEPSAPIEPSLCVEPSAPAKPTGFKYILSILVQDKLLQVLILANIICMFVYAQMDSTLIQYLTRAEVPKLLELISAMIFANAMIIICTQFLLLKLMKNMSLILRIQIGLGLLFLSQIWYALNPVEFFAGWIGATLVLSIAEAILFPTMNVHIDRIAPNHLRGAYFGASSFYELGYALAPLGGGIILDLWGGPQVFWIGAVLTIIAIWLYQILDRLPRPVH